MLTTYTFEMNEGGLGAGAWQASATIANETGCNLASLYTILKRWRSNTWGYADYKILTAADMPTVENFTSMTTDSYPHREGPFGAKGLGEAVVNPYAPAVSNAVYNAVGIRIHKLPITREKVLMALKGEGKGK